MKLATSDFGTFRTWRDVRPESAFGGKAEVGLRGRQGSFRRPKADVAVNRFTRLGAPDRFVKLHQIGALPSPVKQ